MIKSSDTTYVFDGTEVSLLWLLNCLIVVERLKDETLNKIPVSKDVNKARGSREGVNKGREAAVAVTETLL
jgi:hypothetical protein